MFEPKREFKDKKSGVLHAAAVPLQAADLLAGEIFAVGRSVFSTQGVQTRLYRINEYLDKIPGQFGVIERDRYNFIEQGLEESNVLIMVPRVTVKTS